MLIWLLFGFLLLRGWISVQRGRVLSAALARLAAQEGLELRRSWLRLTWPRVEGRVNGVPVRVVVRTQGFGLFGWTHCRVIAGPDAEGRDARVETPGWAVSPLWLGAMVRAAARALVPESMC